MSQQLNLKFLIIASVLAMDAFAVGVPAKYYQSCVSCHAYGAAGAPKTHDIAAWEQRLAKGMAKAIENTKNGIKAMPPKGMCMDCSDADFEALILFMSQPAVK